jgi:hypothetical protein
MAPAMLPAHARPEHPGERTLHLGGLRRGPDRGTPLSARDDLGGGHEPALALAVGAGQDPMQNIRGGRLAVGARNAVDPHARRRIAVDLHGQRRQGCPHVPHDRGRDAANVAFGDHEGGPATDGLCRELRPVAPEAGYSHEGETVPDASRIVRNSPDAAYRQRNLDTENCGKLCPVQEHHPSLASAATGTFQ